MTRRAQIEHLKGERGEIIAFPFLNIVSLPLCPPGPAQRNLESSLMLAILIKFVNTAVISIRDAEKKKETHSYQQRKMRKCSLHP
jgi:hypothetical protein